MMDAIFEFFRTNVALIVFCTVTLSFIYMMASIDMAHEKNLFLARGIGGPRPLPIIGNLIDIILKPRAELEVKWRNEYGKVYVIFYGMKPRLVIADLHLIRDICIENFDCFADKKFGNCGNQEQNDKSLMFLKGNDWRKVRSLMAPTFTTANIKQMFKSLHEDSNNLVHMLKEQFESSRQKLIEVNSTIYYQYSLRSITNLLCSLNMRSEEKFVDLCTKLNYSSFWAEIISYMLPACIVSLFLRQHHQSVLDLQIKMKQIRRKRSGRHTIFNDIFSRLFVAKLGNELKFLSFFESRDVERYHEGYTNEDVLNLNHREMCNAIIEDDNTDYSQLTNNELYSNCVSILYFGSNMTRRVLQAAIYCMAYHSQVQTKLYRLLILIRKEGDGSKQTLFHYEELISNTYLDAFISEVLRLFSPVISTNRECSQDYLLKDYNFEIRKGDAVSISIHGLHTDPDYWPEPEKFDPTRFLPENKRHIEEYSYCPFGLGLRRCLGTRVALAQIKIAVARLVTEFEFFPIDGLKFAPSEVCFSNLREFSDLNVNAMHRNIRQAYGYD